MAYIVDSRRKQTSWDHWIQSIPPEWPHAFFEQGLKPFLQTFGYVLKASIQEHDIVKWAWSHAHVYYYRDYKTRFPEPLYANDEEFLWYETQITIDDWTHFFERWSIDGWCDEYTDYGYKQRLALPRFIWCCIDKDESPKNKEIRTFLYDEEDEQYQEDFHQENVQQDQAYGGDRRTL